MRSGKIGVVGAVMVAILLPGSAMAVNDAPIYGSLSFEKERFFVLISANCAKAAKACKMKCQPGAPGVTCRLACADKKHACEAGG